MILDARTAQRLAAPPGACFELYAGRDADLEAEAEALWSYLRLARIAPVSLTLHPASAAGLAWLGDIEAAVPLAASCTRSTLALFTSGTTAAPKRAAHDLETLLAR